MSTRSRYGLRAMYELAINQGAPIASKTIAQRQGISDTYLEQLMASLRKAGLVISSRGAQGGYVLSRPANEMTIGEILSALEGSTFITDCLDGDNCSNADFCPSKPVFEKIQRGIDDVLNSMTLLDMVTDSAKEEKKQ